MLNQTACFLLLNHGITHLEGSVISKAQSCENDQHQKKKMLKTAFVDNEFKSIGAKYPVTNNLNNIYHYNRRTVCQASRIPFFLSSHTFQEEAAVMGLIGHTQA